jgi:hypothetical protein
MNHPNLHRSFHQVQNQAVLLRFPNVGLAETTCSLSATAACSAALSSHNYFWDPLCSTFLSHQSSPQANTQAARKSCTSRSPVPAHHGTMRMKSMKSVHRTWQEVVTLCWFKLCNCAALPADSVQNGSHEG